MKHILSRCLIASIFLMICCILVQQVNRRVTADIISGQTEEGQENRKNPAGGQATDQAAVQPEEKAGEQIAKQIAKQIALTFDDGPHAVYTKMLLDGLKERGVHATFFLMGQNIEGNEELVKRMEEEGHLIGNHTYSHVQITKLNEEQALSEVQKEEAILSPLIGQETMYFRPPFGSITEAQFHAIEKTVVLWNIDPLDWSVQNRDKVVNHVLNHLDDGPIILLHDIFKPSVEAALALIDKLEEQGYEFVRIDELTETNTRIKVYEKR